MDENLRMMVDAADDLMESTRSEVWKLEQIMFAIAEEAEDDPNSDELPRMLTDAANLAKSAQGGIAAMRDYITDIGRELL